MLLEVCQLCFEEHPQTVNCCCAANQYCLHNEGGNLRAEFSPGKFVNSDNDTSTKIWILRSLFEVCGISFSDLEFEFASTPQQQEITEDDE